MYMLKKQAIDEMYMSAKWAIDEMYISTKWAVDEMSIDKMSCQLCGVDEVIVDKINHSRSESTILLRAQICTVKFCSDIHLSNRLAWKVYWSTNVLEIWVESQ